MGKLKIISAGMGDPIASTITPRHWAHYRDQRLRGEIDNGYSTSLATRKVSTGTVNCEHAFLRAMFNELKRLGEWSLPNPLENIREFDQPEREMAWLNQEQILRLMAACEEHGNDELTLIVKLCLSTGARWNEAAKIKSSQISRTNSRSSIPKVKRTAPFPLPAHCMTN